MIDQLTNPEVSGSPIGFAYTIIWFATIAYGCIVHKKDFDGRGWKFVVCAPLWPLLWLGLGVRWLIRKRGTNPDE